MMQYSVIAGPVRVRTSPFGSLTESYFEHGDVVQVVEETLVAGHVSGREARWARLANHTYICIDDGETQYMAHVAGAVSSTEPAQTRPLNIPIRHI